MTEIRTIQSTEQATIMKQKTVTEILPTPVRTYKDRIFRMIFKDKEENVKPFTTMPYL